MTKREVSRALRAALKAMNDQGRHWIKGRLQATNRKREKFFCAVGAINHVTGVGNRRLSASYQVTEENWKVFYALANSIRQTTRKSLLTTRSPANDEEAVGTIWRFNDEATTDWARMERVFTRAATEPKIPRAR